MVRTGLDPRSSILFSPSLGETTPESKHFKTHNIKLKSGKERRGRRGMEGGRGGGGAVAKCIVGIALEYTGQIVWVRSSIFDL
jgi:hypothetical protein